MVTSETTIQLDRPGRYLTQLCKHAAAMGVTRGGHRPRPHATGAALAGGELEVTVTYTDTQGVITIAPWGEATLTASDSALTMKVQAADADALTEIQGILTRDLERFGRRDKLSVAWTAPGTVAAGDTDGPTTVPGDPVHQAVSQRRTKILLAVVIAVAVAVHLGLGAAILPDLRWTGVTLDILIAVIAVKLLIVALGRRAVHPKHSRYLRAHLPGGRRHGRPGTTGASSGEHP